MLSPLPPGPGILALEQRLQALGWEEGHNLQIDYVQLDNTDADRSLAMAAALVGRGVDAIYAAGPEIALKAAVRATTTVPIVMVADDYDPLARGYIASLARPGGFHRCFLATNRVDREEIGFPAPDCPRPGARGRVVGPDVFGRPVRSRA